MEWALDNNKWQYFRYLETKFEGTWIDYDVQRGKWRNKEQKEM